jgi:hypothetical protein
MPLARYWAHLAGFRVRNSYHINRNIHLGYFWGASGGGMSREGIWKCVPEVGPSKLGNWCQWARLATILGRVKCIQALLD